MSSSHIRQIMDLLEFGPDSRNADAIRDVEGRRSDSNISYEVEPTKVIAKLASYKSAEYTRLAKNLERIDRLEKMTKALKEQVKQDTRDHVADLFSADDTVRTRVVETVSFVFQLTKDPKATTTYKYAEIVKELTSHLTPELITVLESLKKKYEGSTQKAPALSVSKNESLDLNEGVWDRITAVLRKFKNAIMNWATGYDKKLDALKAQAAMAESAPAGPSTGFMRELANNQLSEDDGDDVEVDGDEEEDFGDDQGLTETNRHVSR